MFSPVALQSSKIVAITQLYEQVLQDSPVAFTGGSAIGVLKMVLEVLLDSVVVEQGIVNINKENNGIRRRHPELRDARARTLSQLPPTARRCNRSTRIGFPSIARATVPVRTYVRSYRAAEFFQTVKPTPKGRYQRMDGAYNSWMGPIIRVRP